MRNHWDLYQTDAAIVKYCDVLTTTHWNSEDTIKAQLKVFTFKKDIAEHSGSEILCHNIMNFCSVLLVSVSLSVQ